MSGKRTKIRRDSYKARGGTAQILRLECSRCGRYVCAYQKDGTGNLFRLYWDRIFESGFGEQHHPQATEAGMAPLVCGNCGYVLGVPMTYVPENRLARRLEPGAVHKSRLKG